MESKLVNRISGLKVSNSDPCFHHDHDDQTQKPTLENPEQPSDHDHALHDHPQQEQPKNGADHINTPAKQERRTTESVDVDDDDDGFKTPTSLEHRIPPMTKCPPAPRKPLRKRKVVTSSSTSRRRIQFQFDHLDTKELEAFFASNFLLQDLRAKIKKAKQAHRDETR
ncbi:unnamed protein product [Prunus armeniaca]|uniref:Cyclin-dependent protein kinase inhibitor SMR3 n=1 Tax=Prunus armeniaca TaxID=36596 RepID=A0A6J5V8I8_PRUAR|nr:hypothetical protein GBA52_019339 [Prunus armeniaca]CAB4284492.1 unnamed protein product [Prunus armeniaca]